MLLYTARTGTYSMCCAPMCCVCNMVLGTAAKVCAHDLFEKEEIDSNS